MWDFEKDNKTAIETTGKEKALKNQGLFLVSGGESGIRTRGRVLPYTRFPGVRLKPLIHLSSGGAF